MYAWRVHELGNYKETLRWEDCDDPAVPDDGVRVRVRAASLNFPDLLTMSGKYQVRPPLPFSPGLEAAGEVEAVGPSSRYRVGQRVIVNGSAGAYAEKMAARDPRVFPIPDSMTDVEAAALVVVYQTSHVALVHRAGLKRGESLLVHGGAGGVGTSAIQVGKALGATVIATAGTEAKLEVCRTAGADHVINHRSDDFVARVKDITGSGADVIYDPVGGDVFDASTRCIAWEGRLLVIGFASGRIPEVACNRILLKNISVVGVHWGNYYLHDPELIANTHAVLCDMHSDKLIQPIIYREYPLAELPEALAALETRQSYGKIVVTT